MSNGLSAIDAYTTNGNGTKHADNSHAVSMSGTATRSATTHRLRGAQRAPLLSTSPGGYAGPNDMCVSAHTDALCATPTKQLAQTSSGNHKNHKKNVNFCRAWLNKFPSRSKRIDVISRIFFPKMFALFNLVYWFTYLFREDDIVQA